jgi:glutamine amidotransferase
VLDKQPEPAFANQEFIREAKHAESTTFVAHVRLASVGGRTLANTHPFAMRGRIMAHNGGLGEISRLDTQLGPYRELVLGDTDSERYFALITQQIDAHGGDVSEAIVAAARWIGTRLPVSSLNAVVTTPDELWALRYPGQHALHVISRSAGDSQPTGDGQLTEDWPPGGDSQTGADSQPGRIRKPGRDGPPGREGPPGRDCLPAAGPPASPPAGLHLRSATSSVRAPGLRDVPTVVVASEELDGESGWRMLAAGELIHVRPDLTIESDVVLPDPPARLIPLTGRNPNIDT